MPGDPNTKPAPQQPHTDSLEKSHGKDSDDLERIAAELRESKKVNE